MSDNKFRNLVRAAFLIAGIAMIIYGATRGEAAIALGNAWRSFLKLFGIV